MVGPEIVPPGRSDFSWNPYRMRQPPYQILRMTKPVTGRTFREFGLE